MKPTPNRNGKALDPLSAWITFDNRSQSQPCFCMMLCSTNKVAQTGGIPVALDKSSVAGRLGFTAMLVLLATSLTLQAGEPSGKWLRYLPVVYQENHDPSMVLLKGGIEYEVRYGEVPLEELEDWKPGRKLAFAYRSDTGPVLLDIATGHLLPVVSGWRKHPLDEYVDLQLKKAYKEGSTTTIVMCERDSAELWKKEMTRAYEDLKSRLPQQQCKLLEQAQQAWQRFKKREVELLNSLNDEGTMAPAHFNGQVRVLYENRALELHEK